MRQSIELARAALASVNRRPARCAVDGFGPLGRGVVAALAEAGAIVTAVADEYGCVADPAGLDVARMLAAPPDRPVRAMHVGRAVLPRRVLRDVPADVVIDATADVGASTEAA